MEVIFQLMSIGVMYSMVSLLDRATGDCVPASEPKVYKLVGDL
jgi:hypothetical protein